MDNLQAQSEFYANMEEQHRALQAAWAEDAKAIQDMLTTPGWVILKKFLDEMISGNIHKLVSAREPEEIQRLQEHIKAYKKVLTFVALKMKEGIQPDILGQLEIK